MTVRITFDNHVGDLFDAWPSDDEKRAFVEAFRSGRYALCLSGEVFEETISIAETSRASLLPSRARWILELMSSGGRMLADWRSVARRELVGVTEPFETSSTEGAKRSFLSAIAAGKVPPEANAIAAACRERKESDWARYKELQEIVRAKKKERSASRRVEMTFAGFRGEYWARHERDLIVRFLRREGASDPEARADEIIADWPRHPYNQAHMTVAAAMMWRYFVDDRRVDQGDVYDAGLLVHMVGLDVLVSEDRVLHDVFPAVHSLPKRIITFGEFMSEVA